MSSCSSAPSTVNGDHNYQNVRVSTPNSNESSECPSEHENEDEEDENDEEGEDMDFNPCLMDSPSLEASSSLSSEIEGLDVDVADSRGNRNAALVTNISSAGPDHALNEEIALQTANSSVGEFRTGVEKTSLTRINGRKLDMNVQLETETFCQKMDGTSSRADAVKEIMVGELSAVAPPRKPFVDLDSEDAICRRTRARYSLASFTLDELETFLQETDDDDELQNVDDEEEYRKFLAAVLQGGDGDQQSAREIEDADDEDEDNDADFELELEEALESDLDDNVREANEEVHVAVGRRPNTRQNRCRKDTGQHKRRLLGHLNRPLRPLLPNTQVATFSALDGKCFMHETVQQFLPSATNDGLNIGFTPHQIGQLHCLIHEHVQLLVQVFSLCVSEPARQHIASDVCGLIREMLHKRDQVLGWKRVPHPIFCFFPPYIHPSVPDKFSNVIPAQCTGAASSTDHVQKDRSSLDNVMQPSGIVSPLKGRNEYFCNGKEGHCEVTECFSWAPYISGPVLSVLDVAPLLFVGSYIDDVSSAVREYQWRRVGIGCDSRFEKEPLFPLPGFRSFAEANDQVLRENVPPPSDTMPSPPAKDQIFRKTMAAALVEKAKKQIVAPVPKEIAKLAQRFLPLFNPALYPHKPPPTSLANRVLFTDAEDELLALGLMEYNTDWKAIQQRFLPCKSKHQIFVRQKNRSSSKAPENPIKAVRRMKASPLTSEEKARILHGLKVFKLDWMSIWKFIVPYRDPSLLPRQWRVHTGTQKSYKLHDEEKKAKRRLYESSRRNFKSTSLTSCNTLSKKEENSADDGGGNSNGDDCINKEDEAYVHEAFLADWRPGTSGTSAEVPGIDLGRKSSPTYVMSHETSRVQGQMNNNASVCTKFHTNPEFQAFVRSQCCLQPHQTRRVKNPHLVKLAPDLPPVNLPPSVRVLPQSAFKSYQGGASSKVPGSDGIGGPRTEHGVPQVFHAANLVSIDSVKTGQSGKNVPKQSTDDQRLQYSGERGSKRGAREQRKPDLKMHPLLFQASESSRLPYNPLNCSTGPFCFFPGNQPQLDLNLFHNSLQQNHGINLLSKPLKSKEVSLSSSGIDFHPLLQRTDAAESAAATADLAVQHFSNLESSRCLGVQVQKSDVNNSACATCSKPFSPNVKTSELDLEIHLSVASSRKKAVGSIDLTESNRTSYGKTCDPRHSETSSKLHSDHLPSTSVPGGDCDKLDSGAHSSVSKNDKLNINSLNMVNDQSLPEIVMEQEELSDSEEESEEHVEFECEEMADSEGEEESGTEHGMNLLDKENLKIVREKVANKLDFDNKQGQRSTRHDLEGSICGPSEGCTTELELTDKGEDDLISSSCLNLNSVASVPPPENAERAVMRSARVSDGKDKPLPCSNRPCKITPISKHVNVHKQDGGAIKQSNMTSVAVPLARKRRKRACQTDLRLDGPKKRDSSSNAVTKDSSNHVNYDEIS